MNPLYNDLYNIVFLLLAIIFLTIVLSYLALLIRFCPKNCRLILVRSTTDITVFGPGWIFLKPYRERLLKIDIRTQQCEVQLPLSLPDKILYSFKIVDVQKSALAALQDVDRTLEQSNISDSQKEEIRYSREYNSLNDNIKFLTKKMITLSYIKFAKEHRVDKNIPREVLEIYRTELDGLFIDKGLQLMSLSFSSITDPYK